MQCDLCGENSEDLVEVAIAENGRVSEGEPARLMSEYLAHEHCLPDEGGDLERKVYRRSQT